MRDIDHEDGIPAKPVASNGGWLGKLFSGGLVAVILLYVLSIVSVASRTTRTCVICRQNRVDHSYLWISWSDSHETDCSRWYAANVEPRHTHSWDASPHERMINIFGQPVGCAGRMALSPVSSFSPTTQLGVYRHFKDPTEARALFVGLSDPKVYGERLDDGETKGDLFARAIMAWERAGYPGTWEDWWAKQVQECRVWRESNRGKSFWEWKERTRIRH